MKETIEVRTSEEWMDFLKPGARVLDPDGWDRQNFNYSWNEEPITSEEFENRFYQSTVEFPDFTKDIWL